MKPNHMTVRTFTVDGVEARPAMIEVAVSQSLPSFTIVGLGDRAERETRERVTAAICNCGYEMPRGRVVVNVAPAHIRRAGGGYSVPIAYAILAATDQVRADPLRAWGLWGDLELTGELRGVRGSLAVAQAAARIGLDGLVVAADDEPSARLAHGVAVHGARTLRDVARLLGGRPDADARELEQPDLADIRGNAAAVRAEIVAAAGAHHLLLTGPAGAGRTMLARRIPGILPAFGLADALEIARIPDIAGIADPRGLPTSRPFRAPHHSISTSGLTGGGPVPAPGEVTLARASVPKSSQTGEPVIARDTRMVGRWKNPPMPLTVPQVEAALPDLGFAKASSKWSRNVAGYTIEVAKDPGNAARMLVDYGTKITVTQKGAASLKNPENLVVLECVLRLLNLGYKPEHIELEPTWKLGHKNKGRLDILLYRPNKDAYAMIECKTWGAEYSKERNNLLADGGQLFSYYVQDRKAEGLYLYASKIDAGAVSTQIEFFKTAPLVGSNKNDLFRLLGPATLCRRPVQGRIGAVRCRLPRAGTGGAPPARSRERAGAVQQLRGGVAAQRPVRQDERLQQDLQPIRLQASRRRLRRQPG